MGEKQGGGLLGKVRAILTNAMISQTVSTNDPMSMTTAMAQARETLPVFWEWLDQHQETLEHRAIKFAFETPRGGVEYIWLSDVRRTEFVVTGIVSNTPEDVPDLKEGDIYPLLDFAKIADWTFRQGELYYGHFTTRVLAQSNPAMAAGMKDISETPLPDQVRH
jgi:uncharacterized protein YegJ (DUF2314 family)